MSIYNLRAVTHRGSSESEGGTNPGMEAVTKAPEVPIVRKPVEQLFDGKCNTIATCL